MENQVGFGFTMPNNETLYILSSRALTDEEKELGVEEKIEGLDYFIKWGKKQLFLSFSTKSEAMGVAFGVQWGANNANI